MGRIGFVHVSFLVLSFCAMARAGEEPTEPRTVSVGPFERGSHEFQIGGGFAISENYYSIIRPQLNDVDAQVRLGWMLNSPRGDGIWRGNFEFLVDVFGGVVVKGPGHELVGTTMLLRRNLVFPRWKFVPYYQIGAGGVYSDASEERPQRILGSPVLFNLQAGLGTRYFVTERIAPFLELDYRHISNAGLAERNAGLNSAVGWLGVSWFF